MRSHAKGRAAGRELAADLPRRLNDDGGGEEGGAPPLFRVPAFAPPMSAAERDALVAWVDAVAEVGRGRYHLDRPLLRMPPFRGRKGAPDVDAIVAYLHWLRSSS